MNVPRLSFVPSLTACSFILAGLLAAQNTAPFPAAPASPSTPASAPQAAKISNHPGIHELHDVPYVTGGTARQKLDLYLPETSTAPRPVIAWIHGGGWEGGDKNNCPAKGFVAHGYVVASLGYRLSQHAIYPAQIEDCKAAIRWLRAHANEYGIDPQRIGVWGASAGGHLVALLGATGNIRDFDVGENLGQSSKVQCVVDWFGPTDFLHYGDQPPKTEPSRPPSPVDKLLGGRAIEHQAEAKRASPFYFVTPESAPFLIVHGDKDPLVPLQQSQVLQAALQKAGVEAQLSVVPGAGHGGPGFSSPDEHKRMVDFFDRHLLEHTATAEASSKAAGKE